MAPPVLFFDYGFSPYAQKVRLLFAAAGIAYKRVDQPIVLPRPILLDLDITYRRIPLLALGKDVYADTSRVIEVIQEQLGGLPTSPADRAYEAFADRLFYSGLACIPPSLLSDDFVKDRAPIFPITARPDFKTIGASGQAEFQANLDIIERDFLANANPFIGGDKPVLADIHLVWVARWILNDLGAKDAPGAGKDRLPKLWKLIESLPAESQEFISGDEAKKIILEGQTSGNTSVLEGDVLNIKAGTKISVESTDSAPGANPQYGTLVATAADEVTLELPNGIHLHFPKRGYIFRPA